MLLIRLWCHCGEHHCETGALTGYSEQEIEMIAEWWGEHGKAVEAMMRVGFLRREDNTYIIKDWLEHSGHLAAFKEWSRAGNKKRWDKHRANKGRDPTGSPSGSPTGNPPLNSRLVSSKDSSEMEAREFFNAQVHAAEFVEAKRLVAKFYEVTKSTYRSVKAAAERQIAQLLVDEQEIDVAAIERGFVYYAAQCVRNDEKVCGPTTFFKERRWESYDGIEPIAVENNIRNGKDLENL